MSCATPGKARRRRGLRRNARCDWKPDCRAPRASRRPTARAAPAKDLASRVAIRFWKEVHPSAVPFHDVPSQRCECLGRRSQWPKRFTGLGREAFGPTAAFGGTQQTGKREFAAVRILAYSFAHVLL